MSELVKFLHVLFSFTLFFGLGVAMMNSIRTRGLTVPSEILPLWMSIKQAQSRFVIPSGILLIAFGYASSEMKKYSLFDTTWLWVSLLLSLIVLALGVFVMRRHTKNVIREVNTAIASGNVMTAALKQRLTRKAPRYVGMFQMAALVTIVYLMVFGAAGKLS